MSILDTLGSVAKSETGQVFLSAMLDFLNKISGNASQMNLKELADVYSKQIDKLILRQANTYNYQYIGGEFKIYYVDEDCFGISISLYFQDKSKQWQKTSANSVSQPARYLERSALAELKGKRTIVFNIDEPKNPE